MPRPERGQVKDTTPANTDQETSSLSKRFGEILQGIEIPDPEGLAKEIAAARKRVADSEIGE